MIDTHSHLDNSQFDDDRAETIARAFACGVEAIIIPSIEPRNFDVVKKIAESDPRIWRGIGIHPHNAQQASDEDFERIERETTDVKVVAIGEIGLDYYYDFAPRDTQQVVFREQLRIAKRTDKPVIIHNRESDDDILCIIREEQDGSLRGVMHCFSGSPAMLEETLRLGLCVSYTGNITYKKSILGAVVAKTPLDKMMIETDAPYMTPVPYRGKRNEPSFVRFVAEKIAELHSTTLETVISMTTATAKNLFHLPVLFVFLAATFAPVLAQQSGNPRDEEYEYEEEIVPNPYPKSIGIGATVATNTIIELQECGSSRRSISYDGILSFGGAINYGLLDFITLEASYVYSHNTHPNIIKFYPDGDHYHFISFGAKFIANSHKRIGFFAMAAGSIGINEIQGVSSQKAGVDVGAGFEVHIPSNFGMFVPTAEWRVVAPFGSKSASGNPTVCDGKPGTVSTLYSIPRFTVYWFPKF